MRYTVHYFSYEFNNSTIDENLYQYLKTTSKQKIIEDFNAFKKKEKTKFNEQWSNQILIRRIVFVALAISIIGLYLTWDSNSSLAGFFAITLFAEFLGMVYLQSLGYSQNELRKALSRRKRNLISAHKVAQKSETFHEFLNGIRI